jgi:hypothetical protein
MKSFKQHLKEDDIGLSPSGLWDPWMYDLLPGGKKRKYLNPNVTQKDIWWFLENDRITSSEGLEVLGLWVKRGGDNPDDGEGDGEGGGEGDGEGGSGEGIGPWHHPDYPSRLGNRPGPDWTPDAP